MDVNIENDGGTRSNIVPSNNNSVVIPSQKRKSAFGRVLRSVSRAAKPRGGSGHWAMAAMVALSISADAYDLVENLMIGQDEEAFATIDNMTKFSDFEKVRLKTQLSNQRNAFMYSILGPQGPFFRVYESARDEMDEMVILSSIAALFKIELPESFLAYLTDLDHHRR